MVHSADYFAGLRSEQVALATTSASREQREAHLAIAYQFAQIELLKRGREMASSIEASSIDTRRVQA